MHHRRHEVNVQRRGITRAFAKAQILELLRSRAEGMAKVELVRRVGETSAPTIQRALKELENEGAIARDERANLWMLVDPHFALPLEAPHASDVDAVLVAEALLEPLADAGLRARLRRIAEQLDERIRRSRPLAASRRPVVRQAVTATVTSGSVIDPVILDRLLRACRREVVRATYYSPWHDHRETRCLEPWQVRIHDGSGYLRAWDKTTSGPRTFRIVHIEGVDTCRGERPSARIPPREKLWGEGDPAYGIDEDRPDTAVVRVRGAVARWVSVVKWHPCQGDRWLVAGELLERTLPYRSCREMARRILAIVDAVEDIRPPALRTEVERQIFKYLDHQGRRAKRADARDQHEIKDVG